MFFRHVYGTAGMKLSTTIALWIGVLILSACAGRQQPEADVRDETLNIAEMVSHACQAAVRAGPINRDCPPYLEMLIADGRISVGLGIGQPISVACSCRKIRATGRAPKVAGCSVGTLL